MLSKKWQKERTDNLLENIERLVEEENNICNENNEEKLTTTQLLGYLIYRINCDKDKKTAELGQKIYKSELVQNDKVSFSPTDAVAIMHDLTLTKQEMRTLKSYLAAKNI